MGTQVKTLQTRFVEIFGETAKIEFFVKVLGNDVKCFVAVNDQTFTSVNYYNFKHYPEAEFDFIIKNLKAGAYNMFIKNQ